jgi:hypothetical protein
MLTVWTLLDSPHDRTWGAACLCLGPAAFVWFMIQTRGRAAWSQLFAMTLGGFIAGYLGIMAGVFFAVQEIRFPLLMSLESG